MINHNQKIYQGNNLYGHLELQRECVGDFDYYMSICPDMYFHDHLLFYIIEAAKQANQQSKNFINTPQIYKMWDNTWDHLTHPLFQNIKCF